jgi:hypothetical protein
VERLVSAAHVKRRSDRRDDVLNELFDREIDRSVLNKATVQLLLLRSEV